MLFFLMSIGFGAPPTVAPSGFSISKSLSDCTLMLGPVVHGYKTMRAECHLPNVAPEKVHAWMSDWSKHDEVFSAVVSSEVAGDGTVRQVHQAKGISDREVLLKVSKTVEGDAITYGWTLASNQAPTEGRVAPAFDNGFWKISPHKEGGTLAIHQLQYDPAGAVPGFLVRMAQTSGLQSTAQEFVAFSRK